MAMGDQDEGMRNLVLAVVGGVVGLVLAGTLAAALSSAGARHARGPAPGAAPARTAYGPVETLYFAEGLDKLNADADAALVRVASMARAHPAATIRITAAQLLPAEAQQDPRLAYKRALAVRHRLEASGVPPAQISVLPLAATGDRIDLRAARRVLIRLE